MESVQYLVNTDWVAQASRVSTSCAKVVKCKNHELQSKKPNTSAGIPLKKVSVPYVLIV